MNTSILLWSHIMGPTGESHSITAALLYVALGRISLIVYDALAVGPFVLRSQESRAAIGALDHLDAHSLVTLSIAETGLRREAEQCQFYRDGNSWELRCPNKRSICHESNQG